MSNISIYISLFSLAISATTFWLTRIQAGEVKMTRPTMIYLGCDGNGQDKIFIRTLLYSTSEKGQYIQNMFVSLRRDESMHNFNVWFYEDKVPVRGSGLFINKTGVVCYHHFLLPVEENFTFLSGKYILKVHIVTVDEITKEIFNLELFLTKEQENEMSIKNGGVYFDWIPNKQVYNSNVDSYKRT